MSIIYSIIIPAYNEADELPATLSAVRLAMAAQSFVGECIVVDNNSTDTTALVASECGADRVVFEPENQIARARNTGARASAGRYLIFVDADTRMRPELLEETLQVLESGAVVGGGAVVQFEGTPGRLARFGVGLWERISVLLKIAAGSYLFCQRVAFEAVGGFDEKLYASEEVRLSRLLKKWGRTHGRSFVILDKTPIQTSARKMEWYRGLRMLGWIFFLPIAPIAVRYRKLCGFWYKRPSR